MKFLLVLVSVFVVVVYSEAQYAPSGWRPTGQQFKLPERQQVYTPPRAFVPSQKYGPPETTTEAEAETTTTEIPTTTQRNSKLTAESSENEKIQETPAAEEGVYYIYHPSGLLQKITYSTTNNEGNMEYIAQLKYQNVDPIREPIYTYDPETFVLQKVQV